MTRSVVCGPSIRATIFEEIHQTKCVQEVAMAKDEILVVLRASLTVEVDMEQLSLPKGLGDAVHEVHPGHLLMPDLRIDTDHLAVFERRDERQSAPHRWQDDVASRFVGLGFDCEPDRVALIEAVLSKQVNALAVAIKRRS